MSKQQDSKVAEGALEDALIRRFGISRLQAHGATLRRRNGLIFSFKRNMIRANRYGQEPEYIAPYSPEQNAAMERFMLT